MTVKTIDAARNSTRPNSLTRFSMHAALLGRTCATCLLPCAYDGLQGTARRAGSADLGHRVALRVSGSWATDVVGRQCRACNTDAQRAGIVDLSDVWVSAPWSYLPRPVAKAMRETFAHEDSANLPTWEERRAARAARGIDW